MSLNEILESLGYTTAKHSKGFDKKSILKDGEEAFFGNARAVWRWLRETGQAESSAADLADDAR